MIPLVGGYSYREMSAEEFRLYFQQYGPVVLGKTFTFDAEQALSEGEHEASRRLKDRCSDPFVLRLCIFRGDEFVGWHLGRQEDAQRFYMSNTGILEAHRNRGQGAPTISLAKSRGGGFSDRLQPPYGDPQPDNRAKAQSRLHHQRYGSR